MGYLSRKRTLGRCAKGFVVRESPDEADGSRHQQHQLALSLVKTVLPTPFQKLNDELLTLLENANLLTKDQERQHIIDDIGGHTVSPPVVAAVVWVINIINIMVRSVSGTLDHSFTRNIGAANW